MELIARFLTSQENDQATACACKSASIASFFLFFALGGLPLPRSATTGVPAEILLICARSAERSMVTFPLDILTAGTFCDARVIFGYLAFVPVAVLGWPLPS